MCVGACDADSFDKRDFFAPMADDRVDQDVEQGTGDDIALGSAAFSFEIPTILPRLARNVKVRSPEVSQESNDSRADNILSKDFQESLAIDRVKRFGQVQEHLVPRARISLGQLHRQLRFDQRRAGTTSWDASVKAVVELHILIDAVVHYLRDRFPDYFHEPDASHLA
jgi:hypothetical protein